MTTRRICVDASLIVALLLPERFSAPAWELWQTWMLEDWQPHAPRFLRYEVANALYRKTLQGVIQSGDAQASLDRFLALEIDTSEAPDLPARAFSLAERFQLPNLYDAHYLALAQSLDCPLYTADQRLYNIVHQGFAGIHCLVD